MHSEFNNDFFAKIAVVVLVDGHKTNVKFFSIIGHGELRVRIQHPFLDPEPLFLMFDTVHLLKNFYSNFERIK